MCLLEFGRAYLWDIVLVFFGNNGHYLPRSVRAFYLLLFGFCISLGARLNVLQINLTVKVVDEVPLVFDLARHELVRDDV